MGKARVTVPTVQVRIVATFAAIYIIWGWTYLATRFALETLPPFLLAGGRFLLGGMLLYGIARLRGSGGASRRHWRCAAFAAVCALLGGIGEVA
jgi:drug/metabolite transporter (DMT)-like permease